MTFLLGPKAQAGGYRLLAFDSIGSTNAEALARASQGDPGRLWVAAREQTAGRGRRGRAWATPPGNLAASLLAVLEGPAGQQAATLGFVAGLSLHAALSRIVPEAALHIGLDGGGDDASLPPVRFELKWPNDVTASGAKLAGILLESERLKNGRLAVAVGIGVNVVTAPDRLPYAATSLAALGVNSDAAAVFRALADEWVEFEQMWDGGRRMAEIRRRWLAGCAGLGGPIAVQVGGRVLRGTFETIDDDGRLLIRLPGGETEAIAAAEVHFGAVASQASPETS